MNAFFKDIKEELEKNIQTELYKIVDSAWLEATRELDGCMDEMADTMDETITQYTEDISKASKEFHAALKDLFKEISKAEIVLTAFQQSETWKTLKKMFPDAGEWMSSHINYSNSQEFLLLADIAESLPEVMPEIKAYRAKHPDETSLKEFIPLYKVSDSESIDGDLWLEGSGFGVCLQEAQKRISKSTIENSRIIIQKDFYWLPTSAASHLLMDILSFGVNIADLPTQKKTVSRGSSYSVQASKDKRKVQLNSASAEVTVEISNITKLTGSNKAVKKFLVLSLIKANEQILHNGVLSKDFISFPLHELVDIGFYKTERSARNGFLKAMDALTDMKVQGRVKKSKKSSATITALEVLFTGARIEKNQCIVYFNTRIDWGFLSQFYTTIPGYYFKLSNRGSELLYTISYLARQNTNSIRERGYFDVSARTLQSALQLPGAGCNDPQRDIKNEIEKSVEDLITNHRQSCHNEELYCELLPKGINESPIKEYLDTGYLRVYISGDFAQRFIEIADKKDQKLDEAQKKRDRIREKALVANLEKNLSGDSK